MELEVFLYSTYNTALWYETELANNAFIEEGKSHTSCISENKIFLIPINVL